jgi:hypothetical protein
MKLSRAEKAEIYPLWLSCPEVTVLEDPMDDASLDIAAKSSPQCAFCDVTGAQQTLFEGARAFICDTCIMAGARHLSEVSSERRFKCAHEAIAWHFAGLPQEEIVTTARLFPGHMRADRDRPALCAADPLPRTLRAASLRDAKLCSADR